MKKMLFAFLIIFNLNKIYAIENIKINNEALIPIFDINTKVYNYFTNEDKVSIIVSSSKDEKITGYGIFNINDGKTTFSITSSKYGEYFVRVFKNYISDTTSTLLENLTIEGYDINFNPNKNSYTILLNKENKLNIDYNAVNDNANVLVTGNGSFNKSDNVINIEVTHSNKTNKYTIHALKTMNVNTVQNEIVKKDKPIKKEVALVVIITLSSSFIISSFYLLFIKKLF